MAKLRDDLEYKSHWLGTQVKLGVKGVGLEKDGRKVNRMESESFWFESRQQLTINDYARFRNASTLSYALNMKFSQLWNQKLCVKAIQIFIHEAAGNKKYETEHLQKTEEMKRALIRKPEYFRWEKTSFLKEIGGVSTVREPISRSQEGKATLGRSETCNSTSK